MQGLNWNPGFYCLKNVWPFHHFSVIPIFVWSCFQIVRWNACPGAFISRIVNLLNVRPWKRRAECFPQRGVVGNYYILQFLILLETTIFLKKWHWNLLFCRYIEIMLYYSIIFINTFSIIGWWITINYK